MASARVASFFRKMPRTEEVTVWLPGFFTPGTPLYNVARTVRLRGRLDPVVEVAVRVVGHHRPVEASSVIVQVQHGIEEEGRGS